LIGLYVNPTLPMDDEITNNGINLFLGEPDEIKNSWYASQIGWEDIKVIVNQENELSELTADELKAIFSGRLPGWNNGAGQPIQVWVLPKDDPVRANFDHAVLQSIRLTSEAMLAPNSDAMIEAIASNANAIGYLTGGELSSGDPAFSSRVHVVEIESSLEKTLQLPVIAITQGEPVGLVRELLLCAQTPMP
jgi:phosphate transport system substrate-binding protein